MDRIELAREGFWQRVSLGTPDQCWEWMRSTGSHGYGQWWPHRPTSAVQAGVFDTNWLAHRLAWFLERGPIPPGWTIDHICRNRKCCNPHHLRLLTNRDNARNNGQSLKTACPSGHPYDERNTYVVPASGHRKCRTCTRIRQTRNQTPQKDQATA